MKKNEQILVYRQGDVAFRLVTDINLNILQKAKKLNTKIVATGEHGNPHIVEGIIFEFDNKMYVVNPDGELVIKHPEHDEIRLPGGPDNIYEVIHQRELTGEVRD